MKQMSMQRALAILVHTVLEDCHHAYFSKEIEARKVAMAINTVSPNCVRVQKKMHMDGKPIWWVVPR